MYIADRYNHVIRMITVSTGIISTIAGSGSTVFSGDDGLASSASLCNPSAIAIDSSSGNYYIADRNNNRIRKVTGSTTIISSFAGTGTAGFSGDYGQATSASLYYPTGVALDSSSNVYIADTYNHRVRKVTATTGIIVTIAGTGASSFSGDGVAATSASLYYPQGIATDSAGISVTY